MKLTVELSLTQWRIADISPTILARNYKGMPTFFGGIGGVMEIKPIVLGNTSTDKDSQCNKVYSADGLAMTLTAGTHGYAMGNILVYDEQNKSIRKDIVNTIVTDGSSPKHNPRVIEMAEGGQRVAVPINSQNGICRTIKANYQQVSYANFKRTSTFGATGVLEIPKGFDLNKWLSEQITVKDML